MLKILRKHPPQLIIALMVFIAAIIGQAGYDLYEALIVGRIYLANHGHPRWITFADAPLRFTADACAAAVVLGLFGYISLLAIKCCWPRPGVGR